MPVHERILPIRSLIVLKMTPPVCSVQLVRAYVNKKSQLKREKRVDITPHA
jgi:hypothetical protein